RWGPEGRRFRPPRFRRRRHPAPPVRISSGPSLCGGSGPLGRKTPPPPPLAAEWHRPCADSQYEFRFPWLPGYLARLATKSSLAKSPTLRLNLISSPEIVPVYT